MAGSERLCVGAFSERVIRHFRRLAEGSVPTAAGRVTSAVQALVPGGSRLVGAFRDTGSVFQVPVTHKGVRVVDRAFVEAAHRHGRHVHVWTVDDPDQMVELIELGVDGIFTDRTDVLRQVLTERGEWREPRGTTG
jgi:glycerophosphoryl diester phosphodiesterase